MCSHEIHPHKTLRGKRSIVYCEELLFFEGRDPRKGGNLFKVPYEETIHIDSLKMRTLSPCGTISAGQVASSYENPCIGKGQAFMRKLDWLPRIWINYKVQLKQRWLFRMQAYLDISDPLYYMPLELGGCGLPELYNWWESLDLVMKKYPFWINGMARLIDGSAEPWLRKVARSISSGGIIRGFEVCLREEVHQQYVMSAMFAGHQRDSEYIRELSKTSVDEWRLMPKADMRRIAHRLGYITESDLDLTIERAFLQKEAFQISWGIKKVETKFRLDPLEVITNLQKVIEDDSRLIIPSKEDDLLTVGSYLKDPPRSRLGYRLSCFLHKDVISKHFTQLTTEFPPWGPESEPVARGSIRDVVQ
jgi:hypothetical protein